MQCTYINILRITASATEFTIILINAPVASIWFYLCVRVCFILSLPVLMLQLALVYSERA
jgi:hypothetical protein